MIAFSNLIDALKSRYGPLTEHEPTDPFHQLLWENVGYLASDDRRLAAFELLQSLTDLDPEAIFSASGDALIEVCRMGGIHADLRAQRLREIAQRALVEWDGDSSRITNLELPDAIKALTRFPCIGVPGAEKILLFASAFPLLALDSNGLRVLLRVGYGEGDSNYSRSYRSVRTSLQGQYPHDCGWLRDAYVLLRHHGRATCRRSSPDCVSCPLFADCRYATAFMPE